MRRCWNAHAWRRPSFDQLVTETSAIIAAMLQHCRPLSAAAAADDDDRPAADDAPSPAADYLQPTPRCGDCSRRRPNHADDPARPSINYDRPTSSSAVSHDHPPPTAAAGPDGEQLPWRCTAV